MSTSKKDDAKASADKKNADAASESTPTKTAQADEAAADGRNSTASDTTETLNRDPNRPDQPLDDLSPYNPAERRSADDGDPGNGWTVQSDAPYPGDGD